MSLKIAVVTGSNKVNSSYLSCVSITCVTMYTQGIGYEIAKKLAASGIKTILACRNAELGNKAADDLSSQGLPVEFRQCDIASTSSIENFVSELKSEYGHIDILVNNAAIAFKGSDPTPFSQQAEPTMNINFFGTLHMIENMLPLLKASSEPCIVNVASLAGHLQILTKADRVRQFTNPNLSMEELCNLMNEFVEDVKQERHQEKGWPNTCYGMSKLGVIAMTKVLARDEPSILCTSCCPGYCATDMSSHRGTLTAEEGAITPDYLAQLSPKTSIHLSGNFFKLKQPVEW